MEQTGQLALPGVLLLARLLVPFPGKLWTDWVLVVCVYWILMILEPSRQLRTSVTLISCIYLLSIYTLRQLPNTLVLLNFIPGLGASGS